MCDRECKEECDKKEECPRNEEFKKFIENMEEPKEDELEIPF